MEKIKFDIPDGFTGKVELPMGFFVFYYKGIIHHKSGPAIYSDELGIYLFYLKGKIKTFKQWYKEVYEDTEKEVNKMVEDLRDIKASSAKEVVRLKIENEELKKALGRFDETKHGDRFELLEAD